jgi:superfamily II DNA or RNA helicase
VANDLRQYQTDSIEQLRGGIRAGAMTQVLQLCTGAGKTRIASSMTLSAMNRSKRVLFVCDRIELIEQASERFDAEGIPHGVIQGNHWRWQPQHLVQIATIQTLVNREYHAPDLIFVDECHAGGKRLNDFVRAQTVPVIGLSATPFIRGMGKTWQRLVVGARTQELIDMGFLVPPIVYAPTEPDLSGVKVVAGEYDETQLAAVMDQPQVVGDIVATWLERGENRQTILFAVNIAHSKHMVEQFMTAGIEAEHIDAYTTPIERKRIISSFRRGSIKLLSNVGIVDKGFDVPEASCLIYARPIKSSLALYVQMGGRVLRASPGKTNAIILDHSGNTIRHGFLTDQLPEELDMGKPKPKAKAKPKEREPKRCPKCFFVKAVGVHACPQCGFAPEIPNVTFAEEGELGLLTKTEDKRKLFAEIRFLQAERGYSDGWAAHTFKKMAGVWPNHYKGPPPAPPSEYTRRRVQAMLLAYYKAKEKENESART